MVHLQCWVTITTIWKRKVKVLFAQSCPILRDPMDCSLPGSSVHGILQARILEWPCPPPGDLPKPDLKPRSPTLQVDSLPGEPSGKPSMSSYLQANKLISHSLMDAKKWHRTPKSETKEFITEHGKQHEHQLTFESSFCSKILQRRHLDVVYTCSGLHFKRRTISIQKVSILQWVISMSTLWSREIISL